MNSLYWPHLDSVENEVEDEVTVISSSCVKCEYTRDNIQCINTEGNDV